MSAGDYRSEIRSIRVRDLRSATAAEIIEWVLGAVPFDQRPCLGCSRDRAERPIVLRGPGFHAAIVLDGVPRRRERARVLDVDFYFQSLAAFDSAEALHHMQSLRMRSEIIIDKGSRVQSDRIDDERIAFV